MDNQPTITLHYVRKEGQTHLLTGELVLLNSRKPHDLKRIDVSEKDIRIGAGADRLRNHRQSAVGEIERSPARNGRALGVGRPHTSQLARLLLAESLFLDWREGSAALSLCFTGDWSAANEVKFNGQTAFGA